MTAKAVIVKTATCHANHVHATEKSRRSHLWSSARPKTASSTRYVDVTRQSMSCVVSASRDKIKASIARAIAAPREPLRPGCATVWL